MNDLERYHALRHQIQTMDLIQWHGASLVSKIIRWKTGGSETHSCRLSCIRLACMKKTAKESSKSHIRWGQKNTGYPSRPLRNNRDSLTMTPNR